jgi:hypothetical protein
MFLNIIEYGSATIFMIFSWAMSLCFAQYDERDGEFKLFLWVPPCGIAFFLYRITRAAFLATFVDDDND